MYLLTFRFALQQPRTPQYGRNGTVHAAGAWMLSSARGVFAGMRSVRVWHACGVRWAWQITAGSATHFDSVAIATQPVHQLQICPTVHN